MFGGRVSEHFVDRKYKLSSASLANARCWATQAHASNLEDQNTTDLFIRSDCILSLSERVFGFWQRLGSEETALHYS